MVEGLTNCPIKWIEEEFIRRKKERKQYSLRQFAKKLVVPPGRLSEILSRKRRLTPAIGEKWANRLEFSPKEKTIFLKTIHLSSYKPEENSLFNNETTELKEEVFNLISDWYHFAILSLINTDKFNPDPLDISKKLAISVVEVRNALQRLEKFSLIKKKNKTWIRTDERLNTTWDIPSQALRKSHKQELERAIEAIETVPVELRDISALTFAINPDRLQGAKKLIREFQTKMEEALEVGKRTEVYTLNIQLLPVTRGVKK